MCPQYIQDANVIVNQIFLRHCHIKSMMQIKRLLKQHKLSDVEATDENGDTVFHLALKNDKFRTNVLLKILKTLFDDGLNPNIKNHNKESILHLAIKNRTNDVIEFLLTHKVYFEDSLAAYLLENEHTRMLEREDDPQISDHELQLEEIESANFIEGIVSRGLNIDSQSRDGRSAFLLAFDYNLQHILPMLLKYTGDIDYVESKTNRTLLHMFLENNAVEQDCHKTLPNKNWYSDYSQRYGPTIVQMLLDKGVSTEAVDRNGNTALHLAIEKKENLSIIKMLIEQMKNVNCKNCDGETPFYMVIREWGCSRQSNGDDYLKIAEALIDKGADVNEPNKYGNRPLCCAVERHNLRAVQLLQSNGADFSVITEDRETLLHLLVGNFCIVDSAKETMIKLLLILVSNGCNVNAKDKCGQTALHIAANEGDVVIVGKLIEHGANVNCRNNRGETPLCYLAVYNQSTDVAEVLMQHGANVNAKDFEGNTALHATAVGCRWHKNVKMLQFLLRYGANFNARVYENYSTLRMALWKDYNELKSEDDQIELQRLPSLRNCIDKYSSDEVKILLKHWIKLKVANLKCYTGYDYQSLIEEEEYNEYHEKCSDEIVTLKKTSIDSRTSLYSLIHMDLNTRRGYLNNEKLQKLLHSSEFEKQFPEYSVLIRSSYHEGVTRRTLMSSAKTAWLKLTKIRLPDLCVERVFSFLSNSDLFNIIEKD